jgi:hypothetical protein
MTMIHAEEESKVFCPECIERLEEPSGWDRRDFMRLVGGGVAAIAGLSTSTTARSLFAAEPAAAGAKRAAKPAEDLVKELYSTLTSEQKKELVLPWNHVMDDGKGIPTRLRMYNSAIDDKIIADHYTKPQQELIDRTLRAICSGEDGYHKISRGGDFDGSGSLEGCGVTFFGDPAGNDKYCWLFTGHHLTVRCDGNSEEGTAFGGPMYYGHSPNGYSKDNIFNYQTQSVLSVFEALSEKQRKAAIVPGTPGEQLASVKLRPANSERPGIAYADLSQQQQELVTKVMRDVLSPYRKEDADEVMQIIKATGGMEKIHLAFYEDSKMNDNQRWHFWRLEGPGFVWNYRVLPHVHTFVNITSKLA